MDAHEQAQLLEAVTRPEQPRRTPEARLQAAEDRETIRDLIMRYGYLEDARRWDDMLALYTDDIERVLAGSLVEEVRGKDTLRERLIRPVMVSTDGQPGASQDHLDRLGLRHLMAGEVIRLSDDGTEAVAAVQYTMVATRDDEDGFRRGSHEGSYVFAFRREAGTWKFCRQVIITDNAHNPMFRT
jgi:3-phenylpropionate/cinnamic acid dioxygenase small subunit